jgi:hypothetical protein
MKFVNHSPCVTRRRMPLPEAAVQADRIVVSANGVRRVSGQCLAT